jgi:hypothetical protein
MSRMTRDELEQENAALRQKLEEIYDTVGSALEEGEPGEDDRGDDNEELEEEG